MTCSFLFPEIQVTWRPGSLVKSKHHLETAALPKVGGKEWSRRVPSVCDNMA